jgi:hypothetical protein
MKAFIAVILMTGCAHGQLTVGTNDIWRLKKGDIVVTNVTLNAGQITGIPHETNTTAHASLFAGKVSTSHTNDAAAHSALFAAKANASALANYLPLAGGSMGINATITMQSSYWTLQFGSLGGLPGFLYYSPMGPDATFLFPEDVNGTFYLATREWAAAQYAPKAHTNDSAAHASLLAGKVPTSRTITVNGSTGTLSSNLSFTVTAGITGATVTNIVNAFTFTNQTWAAAGTNATYRIYWDVTNGTFGVQEILP